MDHCDQFWWWRPFAPLYIVWLALWYPQAAGHSAAANVPELSCQCLPLIFTDESETSEYIYIIKCLFYCKYLWKTVHRNCTRKDKNTEVYFNNNNNNNNNTRQYLYRGSLENESSEPNIKYGDWAERHLCNGRKIESFDFPTSFFLSILRHESLNVEMGAHERSKSRTGRCRISGSWWNISRCALIVLMK